MISFVYHGEAVGKGRPRYSNLGGYVHTYTPAKTKEFEKELLRAFLASTKESLPVYPKGTPLYAEFYIGVKVPKSYSKKRRAKCLSGDEAPLKKPDIDNVIKAILDALNGSAYDDDSQVIQVFAQKNYTENPFVEIHIGERYELR